MTCPAAIEAARDPLLLRRHVLAAAYAFLSHYLHVVEFRRLRVDRLGAELGVRPETAGEVLRTLRRAGYIERGERVMDVFTYRLVYSRPSELASKR